MKNTYRLQDVAVDNFIAPLLLKMSPFFRVLSLLSGFKHGKGSNEEILMLNLKKIYLIKCLYRDLRNCI